MYAFENPERPRIEGKGSPEATEVKIEEDDGEGFAEGKIEQIEEIKVEKPEENHELVQLVLEEGEEDLKTEEISEARTEPQTSFVTLNSGLAPTVLQGSSGFQIAGQFQTNQGSGINEPCA